MRRISKWKLALSSAAVLLPIPAGLILWNRLPAQMTTHWGADGLSDGWSGKAFAVFGLPIIILLLHWVCIFFTSRDPKNREQDRKVFDLILWVCPVISVFVSGFMYSNALGNTVNIDCIPLLIIGLLLLVVGNYLPKCRQNHTIGIKVKWALENEENWNATHRLAGKVWVIGGLFLLFSIFLPENARNIATPVILIPLLAIPIIYSWLYARKQKAAGIVPDKSDPYFRKLPTILLTGILGIVTILLAVTLFTGNIDVQLSDASFTVNATYWQDITVNYADIDSVKYREDCEAGSRTSGFGSPRLSMGLFQNDEFGSYTRYSYTKCGACVVLEGEGKILVIGCKTPEETKALYAQLTEKIK